MIKYLGSKRTLIREILASVPELPPSNRSVLDLFSGTSRVGHAFKRAGFRVIANDHNAYAHCLAQCYIASDREQVERDAERLITELNALAGRAGYFTQTFCVDARFFQPHNGERIDAIREAIEQKSLSPNLRSVLLVSLLEAADRVDSTCAVQMAYLKQWAPRAYNPLHLRMPDLLPRPASGKCEAHQLEASAAASLYEVDIAYLDPPYNQHNYLSNYHIWESLILWDKPEVYGIARKRSDCRTRKSAFNSKRHSRDALLRLIGSLRARWLLVSFSNEGHISRDQMESLLSTRGKVTVIESDYKRYVGAQIGIYNPKGKKVGTPGRLRNLEYLYLVETDGAKTC